MTDNQMPPLSSDDYVWRIETFEWRPIQLDFSSSSQSNVSTRSLFADDVCLVNATSLLDFETVLERLQVHICESCGITQCEPGGWIALRRLESAVLWIPSFDDMVAEGLNEFAPPKYGRRLPWFTLERYAELRDRIPGFPPVEAVRPLRSREAIRLMQESAPGQILGKFPDVPKLTRSSVIASNSDNLDSAIAQLEMLIQHAWHSDDRLDEAADAAPVTFRLDIPGTPDWTPFGLLKDLPVMNVCGINLSMTDDDSA